MRKKSPDNQRALEGAYRFGAFDLYPSERQLHRHHKPLPLSPKVFDALLVFVRNAERLVCREALVDALWPDTFVTDANLTNVIVSLRKILGREAIQTVSKFGYRFTMPVLGEPGIDQATYAMFLKGKELATFRSLESMARARDLFSLCVANDPLFAAAWAWLGRCCRFLEKFDATASVNLELGQAALRRALAIDPHLACGHHFYTQLQADMGQAREAMVRLVERIAQRGGDPESFAGLVQTLRFCGLLEESAVAHDRAVALDPTVVTSIPHTHFLRGEYEATLETYGGTRYYLDAAAWAALGDAARAKALLAERLKAAGMSREMSGLMGSLLAVLEGRHADAIATMTALEVKREPEIKLYLARHFGLMGAASECVELLRRARKEGLTASRTLEHDSAFAALRHRQDFREELDRARATERESRRALDRAGGARVLAG